MVRALCPYEFDQLRWLTGQEIGALRAVASGLVPDAVAALDAATRAAAALPVLSPAGAGPRDPGA